MNTDKVVTVNLIDSVKDWRLRLAAVYCQAKEVAKRKWCGEMPNSTKKVEIIAGVEVNPKQRNKKYEHDPGLGTSSVLGVVVETGEEEKLVLKVSARPQGSQGQRVFFLCVSDMRQTRGKLWSARQIHLTWKR